MTRLRSVTVTVLNIVLPPPHRTANYAHLWLRAFGRQVPVKLRGDVGGMIGSANVYKGDASKYIWGDLYKFVNIDLDGKWLDLATREAAPPEEVGRQVRIPETFRPNLRILPYVFLPQYHRLLFVSDLDQKNKLSPNMGKSLVERLLGNPELLQDFGEPIVTVEPERETLKTIFSLPVIKHLYIEVSPPNAMGDIERNVLQWMEDQNATSFSQELNSKRPDGLSISKPIQQVAAVAQSNGMVAARGVNDEGSTVTLSTRDHPYQEKIQYNANLTTAGDALAERAEELINNLVYRAPQDD